MRAHELTLLGLLSLLTVEPPAPVPDMEWVSIAGGEVRYQLPGANSVEIEEVAAFVVMKRQVSQAEYAACVKAKGCAPLDSASERAAPDLPVVGISWLDAMAYAAWLSQRDGRHYRLPHYGEWRLAAGSAYVEEVPLADDPRNPAQRWLAEYEREARRSAAPSSLQPFASQGQNAAGLWDVAGNVWEWTDSCFAQPAGRRPADGFCGIRIAAGRHPSALTDFIRDPISGACSVGVPPTHIGLRLVRE